MRDGLEDLWDLIAHMRKEKIAGTSTTIFHMNDVLLAYNAKVQSLLAEMKANARQGIQIGGPRKADSLLNAAQVTQSAVPLPKPSQGVKRSEDSQRPSARATEIQFDAVATGLKGLLRFTLGTCTNDNTQHTGPFLF